MEGLMRSIPIVPGDCWVTSSRGGVPSLRSLQGTQDIKSQWAVGATGLRQKREGQAEDADLGAGSLQMVGEDGNA